MNVASRSAISPASPYFELQASGMSPVSGIHRDGAARITSTHFPCILLYHKIKDMVYNIIFLFL